MSDLPEVKLKALVNFPANVFGRTAISFEKTNGAYYVDLNYNGIQITPSIPAPDMPNTYNLVWDFVKQTYFLVPFALQATAGVVSIGGQDGVLNIGTGLAFSGDTLRNTGVISLGGLSGDITAGNGLTASGATIAINAGDGLDFSAGALKVNAGTGLAIVSDNVVVDFATQAEAIAGTSATDVMSPLRVQQAMAVLDGPRALPPPMTPTGLLPIIVQRGAGPGRVTMNMTPGQYARDRNTLLVSGSSRAYIDLVDGTDAPGSGSSVSPYSTLQYAASNGAAQTYIVRAGNYEPPVQSVLTDPCYVSSGGFLKQFFLAPGVTVAVIGPRLQDQTWTYDSGTIGVDAVYVATLSLAGSRAVQRVVRRDLYDFMGQPIRLTQYANSAALTAAAPAQGYCFDQTSKEIRIRLTGGASVIAFKTILKAFYLDASFDANWTVQGLSVLIQAMTPDTALLDGVGVKGTDVTGGSRSNIYAEGLRSRFAPFATYQTFGGVNYFKDCRGHASVTDIFNLNPGAISSTPSQCFEVDSVGTSAGDTQTFGTAIAPNRNGSSAHDFVDVSRFGCMYQDNFGPQVADIVNAATGSSWNIGVITGPTQDPQSIGLYAADPGRSAYYDMCHSWGTTTGLTAAAGVNKVSGCNIEGAINGSPGTYDPRTGL